VRPSPLSPASSQADLDAFSSPPPSHLPRALSTLTRLGTTLNRSRPTLLSLTRRCNLASPSHSQLKNPHDELPRPPSSSRLQRPPVGAQGGDRCARRRAGRSFQGLGGQALRSEGDGSRDVVWEERFGTLSRQQRAIYAERALSLQGASSFTGRTFQQSSFFFFFFSPFAKPPRLFLTLTIALCRFSTSPRSTSASSARCKNLVFVTFAS
jgi:hypothetical protein